MIDLDAIADRRARALAQDRAGWLDAVWSEPFQRLSGRLTDGEIHELLGLCASANELVAVTDLLGKAPDDASQTPFEWFKAEAARADQSPAEFARRAPGSK